MNALQQYLHQQLDGLRLRSSEERRAIEILIQHIDSDGYMRLSTSTISKLCNYEVSAKYLDNALLVVQQLRPAGVGARNLRECLLLQIAASNPNAMILRTLVMNDLIEVNDKEYDSISKNSGIPKSVIVDCVNDLKKLTPFPGRHIP